MVEEITRYGRNALYVAKAGAAMRRLRQAVPDRKGGGGSPVVTGCLVEDMGEVIGHGLLTQSQCLGDLTIAPPLGNELEHRDLALGQVGWERWGERLTRLMRKDA